MKRLLSMMLAIMVCLTAITSAFAMDISNQTGTTLSMEGMEIAGVSSVTSSKAIVIIPGVGGSILKNSAQQVCWIWLGNLPQLACNTSGVSVNNISAATGNYGIMNYYQPLYNTLNQEYGSEYQILFFPYDWRLSCSTAASQLATATSAYDELILVAHSMGGLVASSFCSIASYRSKVDKLITLGTPFTGAPKLIYVAETGDFDPWVTVAALGRNTVKDLVQNFHCTYQLAPTERYSSGDYISVYRDTASYVNYGGTSARSYYSTRPWATVSGTVKPMYAAANAVHNSFLVSGVHIANGNLVDTYKINGRGIETISKIVYDENGNYLNFEVTNNGDGTVPRFSASNTQYILESNGIYEVDADHMGLIDNDQVNNRIKQIINGTLSINSAISPSSVPTQVNDKGWIVGEDNRRIYITVDSSDEVEIFDSSGNVLTVQNSHVYNNLNERVGMVGIVGNNGIKYCLYDDQYSIHIANSENLLDVKVEYQDNGYYQHIVDYNQMPASQVVLDVADNSHRSVTCTVITLPNELATYGAERVPRVITPTHVMSEEELRERNQY